MEAEGNSTRTSVIAGEEEQADLIRNSLDKIVIKLLRRRGIFISVSIDVCIWSK
jgi:hypothetical protein